MNNVSFVAGKILSVEPLITKVASSLRKSLATNKEKPNIPIVCYLGINAL
jgi:hypothetical protein